MLTLLDGPLGTELDARGVSVALPLWSAGAIDSAPEVIAAIHREYAAGGATVHTANTFRTKRRAAGEEVFPLEFPKGVLLCKGPCDTGGSRTRKSILTSADCSAGIGSGSATASVTPRVVGGFGSEATG